MKKVLFVCPSLAAGGAEKAAIAISNYLVETNKYDIYFLTFLNDMFLKQCLNNKIKFIKRENIVGATLSYEYAKSEGEPFYPIPTSDNRELYLNYRKKADELKSVIFCGRLAEYQYYNMDQVVAIKLKVINEMQHD